MRRLLASAAFLLLAGPAAAGERECLHEYESGNYTDAFVACSRVAETATSPAVGEAMGFMHLYGRGADRDSRQAVRYFRAASEQGSALAAYTLGQIYGEGVGAVRDERLAAFYNRLAAERGHVPAVLQEVSRGYGRDPADSSPAAAADFDMLSRIRSSSQEARFLLAECYRTGYGTPRNTAAALDLYRKVADPASDLRIGMLREEAGDTAGAEIRYRRAAENCPRCSGEAYYRLGLLKQDFTLLEKALSLGYYEAELELSRRLISSGGDADLRKAEKYLRDACRRGLDQGCLLGADVYFTRLPGDPVKTADYVMSLLRTGGGEAFALLGREYLRGGHLRRDPEAALRMLETARRMGSLRDPVSLAELYRERGDLESFRGICHALVEGTESAGTGSAGAARDAADCRALLAYDSLRSGAGGTSVLARVERSFAEGSARAGFILFTMLSRGEGTQKDPVQAEKYLRKAAEMGDPGALDRLFHRELDAGRFDGARICAERLMELRPAAGLLRLGQYYLRAEPRNYALALKNFELAARSGSDEALLFLGEMREKGQGAPRDVFLACEYYRRAAAQKVPGSSRALSACLWDLHEGDVRSFLPYLEAAAADGDVESIRRLMAVYSDDESGTRNDRELVRWVTAGAKLGMMDCLYRLGDLYMQGMRDILDRDIGLGIKYLGLAMQKGSSPAAWSLASFYAQSGKHREACGIYEKFAASGDYPFQQELALCYINGRGRPRDLKKGEELLLDAYTRNQSSEVAYLLGQTYSDESSPLYSMDKAVEWYMDAADLGDTGALFNLGALYERSSPEFSLEKAFHYYSKSMETGNMAAQLKVAQALFEGRGTVRDPRKGCDLAEEAVEFSITDANPILALCYLTGRGREKSFDRAVALLHDGSDNRNTQSSLMLADIYSAGIQVDPDLDFACGYYYQAVLSSQTVEELDQSASRFLPGKLCHGTDHRTYVALSMLSRKLNTARYSAEILRIRGSLKEKELRNADELLKQYGEDGDED